MREKRPWNGNALAAQSEPIKTVLDAVDTYAKSYLPDLRNGSRIERILRREFKSIQHLDVRAITSDHILKIVQATHDRGKRNMSNLIRAYMSGFFTFAISRNWISENPVAKVKRQYKPPSACCS
jgi:site-specific recombinase XerD